MNVNRIWFADGRIWATTDDGRELWQSLLYYKRLLLASDKEREEYEFTAFGIHWESLDEDVSFESFEYPAPEPNVVGKVFLMHPELNASAVARKLGMKQSLLAAYICGTKRPSAERESQIIGCIRQIGSELAGI